MNARSSRPLSPGTSLSREESGRFGAERAEFSSAGVTLADMLAPLFHDADFAVVPFRSGMQRDRQTDRRLLDVDLFGGRVRLDKLIQMVEQRFCHHVGDIIADPLAGHEE